MVQVGDLGGLACRFWYCRMDILLPFLLLLLLLSSSPRLGTGDMVSSVIADRLEEG